MAVFIKKNGQLVPLGSTRQVFPPKPQLFAPVVTGGVNTISWANDTRNGDFEVTITANVDGTPVTSPLTITEDMDGSTLTITASAENFESNSSVIELVYMDMTKTIIALPLISSGTLRNYQYLIISETYGSSAWKAYYNGVEYTFDNTQYKTALAIPVQFGETQQINLSFKATQSNNRVNLFTRFRNENSYVETLTHYGNSGLNDSVRATYSITALINGNIVGTKTITNKESIAQTTINTSILENDILTIILNATELNCVS